ncbi:MAG: pilus assembly protein [Anaerolineae bacterium]|nr:pilus assembly protein [Anaerolineae bacterium]
MEFALILPLIALLLMGVVDVGRAFHHYIVVTNAAREGARRASRWYPDDADMVKAAVVQEAANSGVELAESLNTVISVGGLNGTAGSPISVTVRYTYTTIIGGLIGMKEFPMSSSTEMVIFGR